MQVFVAVGSYYIIGFLYVTGWYIENTGTENDTRKNLYYRVAFWPIYYIDDWINLFKERFS
jgi:hypothetical protein